MMMKQSKKRKKSSKRFKLTPVQKLLLIGDKATIPYGLWHLHTARPEQLAYLHSYSPKSEKLIQARMHTLEMEGYVLGDALPSRNSRPPKFYVVGNECLSWLRELEYDIDDALRPSREVGKNYLFVKHDLELTDLYIAAMLLERAVPDCRLVRFIHERKLKADPYRVTWRGEQLYVAPDGRLDFLVTLPSGNAVPVPILLEHDRGTEEKKNFRRHFRALVLWLKSEAPKDSSGTPLIVIAFTTFEGPKRLIQMREWARQELTLTNEPREIALAFRFAALTKPLDPAIWLRRCWYSVYEQQPPISLLGGE